MLNQYTKARKNINIHSFISFMAQLLHFYNQKHQQEFLYHCVLQWSLFDEFLVFSLQIKTKMLGKNNNSFK
jgi:hypothetical protein